MVASGQSIRCLILSAACAEKSSKPYPAACIRFVSTNRFKTFHVHLLNNHFQMKSQAFPPMLNRYLLIYSMKSVDLLSIRKDFNQLKEEQKDIDVNLD